MRREESTPEVSVMIVVWNGEAYLSEAIESVLAQRTSVHFELIIVDDGSSDRSLSIARNYSARDCRVRTLTHEDGKNHGISASRNLSMSRAKGRILAFLDADDVWLDYKLEHQVSLLHAYPEAAMVYGQAERWWDRHRPFDECQPCNGSNFIPPLLPEGERAGLLLPPTLLRWFLGDESLTPCNCSVLVRTDVARGVGGFEESFRGLYDDQAFYAKVALAEPILADLRCVARYRRHPHSCCSVADEASSAAERAAFLAWLSAYTGDRQFVDVMKLDTASLPVL